MEILVLLIAITLVLMSCAGAIFIWAVNARQFDDLDEHALDILEE